MSRPDVSEGSERGNRSWSFGERSLEKLVYVLCHRCAHAIPCFGDGHNMPTGLPTHTEGEK